MAFMKSRINGPCLLRVTEDTLAEIGVEAIGDRFKLIDYIEQVPLRRSSVYCFKQLSPGLSYPFS
eukprot:433329-Rhodomonas_salina.3